MASGSASVVLINLFEVPPGVDERFIGAWERARDFLQDRDGYIDTSLHRSIAPDADFRFVNVAHWASPQAFQAATSHPDFPGGAIPFPAHPALYTVVREDSAPAGAPQGVILINAFEVPPNQDEAFLSGWEATRDVLREQPGYLATQLHRSLSPQADFRFVNVGRYESPQAFRSAIQQPAFRRPRAASHMRRIRPSTRRFGPEHLLSPARLEGPKDPGWSVQARLSYRRGSSARSHLYAPRSRPKASARPMPLRPSFATMKADARHQEVMVVAAIAYWHGWWILPFFWVGWALILVLLFGFGGRWLWWRRRYGEENGRGSGARVLGERYARGEIDEDEYRRRLAVLKEGTS